MRFHGTIKNGMFSNQAIVFKAYKELEGKRVTVDVSKQKAKRTLPQNSYLWGVVYQIIADYIGDDVDAIHESMGQEFRRYKDDNGMWKIRSTTEMSTDEFTTYVELVRRWAAQFLSLSIPDPQ